MASPPSSNVTAAVDVAVSQDLSTVGGVVDLELTNTSELDLDEIPLWVFPERLRQAPATLDEVTEPRLFPSGFDAGSCRITAAHVAGAPVSVRSAGPQVRMLKLPRALPPGDRVEVRVAFETRVPLRFGPFGRAAGQLTMDGGFFPRPPPLGPKGYQADRPPDDLDWTLTLRWTPSGPPALAVVNGRIKRLGPAPAASFGPARSTRVSVVLLPEAPPARAFDTSDVGVRLVRRKPGYREPATGLIDLGEVDAEAQLLGTAAHALRWLARHGLAAPVGPFTVVVAPLRRDLALPAPGMLLVSDRLFEIVPLERFRKFHRIALVRAVADTLAQRRLADSEPTNRRLQLAEMIAVRLSEQWERERYGGKEGAREVLAPGAFVAAVDDVITAPQLPFMSAYFRVVDDTDGYRDRLPLFSHLRPGGRFLLARLEDRIGRDAAGRVLRATLDAGLSLEAALAAEAPDLGATYLWQWDQGRPTLNYRLGEVTEGDDQEGHFIDVEVIREGDVGTFEEMVELRLTGSGGATEQVEVLVDAAKVSARVRTALHGPEVLLDPRYRLVESDLGRRVDARFDNRNYDRWRFLVEGFYFALNTASQRLDLSFTALVKRNHDPTHTLILTAADLERSLGVGAGWTFGFGPKVRANRLRYSVGGGASVSWLKPVGDVGHGFGLRLSVSLTDFTYMSRTDPRDGAWLSVRAGPILAAQDGRVDVGGFAEARVARVFEVADGHAIAARVQINSVVGRVAEGQRLAVGGLSGVRAFPAFARSGRHRGVVSFEWRHRFTRDMKIDLLRTFWIEGIDGVLFADAALIGDRAGDFATRDSLYIGIGYGLRLHYLLMGFHPMVLLVDVGFPVVEAGRPGPQWSPPFSLVVALGQAF